MKSQDILLLFKLICLEKLELEVVKKDELLQFINENPEVLLVDSAKHEILSQKIKVNEQDESQETLSDVDEKWDKLDEERSFIKNQEQGWVGWNPEPTQPSLWFQQNIDIKNIHKQHSIRGISELTGISKTEVGNSLNRSYLSGLAFKDRKNKHPRVQKRDFYNFIVHGLKYVFPAEVSMMERGIPTSFASPALREHVESAGNLIYIWPDPRGKSIGQSVKPLFTSVPFAVKQDRDLYELLALADAIRLGNAREAKLATTQLEERIFKKNERYF